MNPPLEASEPGWAELFQAWNVFIPSFLKDHYETRIYPPLLISDDILIESKYLAHFPQQVFSVKDRQKASGQSITPAACLHVYPRLRDQQVKNSSTFILAHCARFENGIWEPPYRLPDFHMAELVVIGEAEFVRVRKEQIKELIDESFTDLGLSGSFHNATDVFFLGQNEGAKIIQQLKGLKQEYRVKDAQGSVALASINDHEDFFGNCFKIKSQDSFAYSFCAAFGVERLAAYTCRLWGSDQKKWPDEFKEHVGIL